MTRSPAASGPSRFRIRTASRSLPAGRTSRISHNRVYGGYLNQSDFGNAAITMGGNFGGIVVNNNLLAGGGYTLYCAGTWRQRDASPGRITAFAVSS